MSISEPQRPPQPRQSGSSSVFGILLALSFCAVVLAIFTALTPWLVLVVVVLFAVVGLQYFLWGWWLGHAIREEEAEAERQSELPR